MWLHNTNHWKIKFCCLFSLLIFQKVLLETVCEWSFHLNWAKLLLDTVYEWFQTFNKMVHIRKIIILLLFFQFPCHHISFCWFPKKIASFVLWNGDFVIFCLMNILNRSDDTLHCCSLGKHSSTITDVVLHFEPPSPLALAKSTSFKMYGHWRNWKVKVVKGNKLCQHLGTLKIPFW